MDGWMNEWMNELIYVSIGELMNGSIIELKDDLMNEMLND